MMQGNKSKGGMSRWSSSLSSLSSLSPLLLLSILTRPAVQYFRKCSHLSVFSRRNDPALPVVDYAINGTRAMLLGFMKARRTSLPFVIVAHAGPVGQSAPKLA
jgi:hypothetical protein